MRVITQRSTDEAADLITTRPGDDTPVRARFKMGELLPPEPNLASLKTIPAGRLIADDLIPRLPGITS